MKQSLLANGLRLSVLALIASSAATAQAGGYLTNTNQSVAFLRNPARDAVIAIDGAYSNPAGIGFLSNGWHFGLNVQSAYQSRTTTSYFGADAPFSRGVVNGVANPTDGRKRFPGKAKAPVLPSFDLARVGDKWFASFHFGITGGGGKCKFSDGLGSFESQVAMIPTVVNAVVPGAVSGYSMDTHMQGRQYYFGGQFGMGYKFSKNLSASVGLRVVYADCNYYGYVRNIGLYVNTPNGAVSMPAGEFFNSQGMPHFSALVEDKDLNADQTGWGYTPIVSLDYKTGRLNLAAKYEFKTRLRLENRTGMNTSGLAEYDDGRKLAADIPAILTLGAQYEIVDGVRASAGFHYYFDKQATQHENREQYLESGGWEVLVGMEWDVAKRWTVSAGWQTTNYGLGDEGKFLSDMSFVTNSNSIGFGACFKLKEKVKLNIAYFKTFYQHYRKDMADYDGLRAGFEEKLQPLGAQLSEAGKQMAAILANPAASEAEKAVAQQQLAVIQKEAGALGAISTGLAGYSTAGRDVFHRTNDVFGLGLEIDF